MKKAPCFLREVALLGLLRDGTGDQTAACCTHRTVRGVAQQLDIFRQVLDKTSKSEEKRKLEESIGGLAATIDRTQNDAIRIVTEEIARWKKLFDKFFPPEAEKTV